MTKALINLFARKTRNWFFTPIVITPLINKQSEYIKGVECSSCKSKPLCTKGKARQIHVEKREPLRALIRQLLNSEAGRQRYKLRQQIIEPIFGNIKHNLQYTMLHLRSLRKVNAEWQLICLTHNVKQIWKAKLQAKGISKPLNHKIDTAKPLVKKIIYPF